ncbi:DUF7118 family protein [Halobaculum sp. P14]|uniref:DUF7118 family protein n=1 Tax=Halobaculum sp. P14 TaxID=3421638 RepID=UPI003EB825CE
MAGQNRDTGADADRDGDAGGSHDDRDGDADAADAAVDTDVAGLVAELRDARDRRRAAEAAVRDVGEDALEAVADAVERADGLLRRYEDSATGTGDFEAYLEFQSQFAELAESLPDDLPARDAFDAANDIVDQRRLSDADFADARDALAPARDLADRLAERERAEDAVADAERRATDRLAELDDRIDSLERLLELGAADLSAPTERLRDPISSYNDAVTDAFDRFRREEPARTVLRVVDDAASFPLVDAGPVPAELREYVESHAAGDEPVPTLLEYADYSQSKLSHYVDDTDAFRTTVPVHRTALDRLSADPYTVDWPPAPAGELRAVAGELVSVTAKFADEEVVARVRRVGRLADRDDYDRLRTAAEAEARLGPGERDRLERGGVQRELDAVRAARSTLADALAEDDERDR